MTVSRVPYPISIAKEIVSYIDANDDDMKKNLERLISKIFKSKSVPDFVFNGYIFSYKKNTKPPIFYDRIVQLYQKTVNLIADNEKFNRIKAVESTSYFKKYNEEGNLVIKLYNCLTNISIDTLDKLQDGKNDYQEMIDFILKNQPIILKRLSDEIYLSFLKLMNFDKQYEFFHERIKKIWCEKEFIDKYDEEINPIENIPTNHPIILEAIDEELRSIIAENILLNQENFFKTGEEKWSIESTKWQCALPKKDLVEMDKLMFSWWDKKFLRDQIDVSIFKSKDPFERIKEYDQICIQKKINFEVPYQDQFLKEMLVNGSLSLNVNLNKLCNENIKGYFFEIYDEKGAVRGYLMGSIHVLPEEFLKLRRIVRKSFESSDAYMFEYDFIHDYIKNSLNNEGKQKIYNNENLFEEMLKSYVGETKILEGEEHKALDLSLMVDGFLKGKELLRAETQDSMNLAIKTLYDKKFYNEESLQGNVEDKKNSFFRKC